MIHLPIRVLQSESHRGDWSAAAAAGALLLEYRTCRGTSARLMVGTAGVGRSLIVAGCATARLMVLLPNMLVGQ
jgi:hypothetical protein